MLICSVVVVPVSGASYRRWPSRLKRVRVCPCPLEFGSSTVSSLLVGLGYIFASGTSVSFTPVHSLTSTYTLSVFTAQSVAVVSVAVR